MSCLLSFNPTECPGPSAGLSGFLRSSAGYRRTECEHALCGQRHFFRRIRCLGCLLGRSGAQDPVDACRPRESDGRTRRGENQLDQRTACLAESVKSVRGKPANGGLSVALITTRDLGSCRWIYVYVLGVGTSVYPVQSKGTQQVPGAKNALWSTPCNADESIRVTEDTYPPAATTSARRTYPLGVPSTLFNREVNCTTRRFQEKIGKKHRSTQERALSPCFNRQ